MTVKSVLKTLSVTTVAMTAAVSTIAPAQALSLNGSLTLTGTAVFGNPNEAAPQQDTLGFTFNRVENDASGDFSSLAGLASPPISIQTLNLNRMSLPQNPVPGVTTSLYNFSPSNNPFIDFGNQDLFNTGVQSLTFNIDPGIAQRNFFSNTSFNTINLTEVTGTFFYGGNSIGKGSLSASRAGNSNGYEITLSAEPIPEPFTILGSLSALAVGTLLKKEQNKRQNKA